jgi:hypothetical protein
MLLSSESLGVVAGVSEPRVFCPQELVGEGAECCADKRREQVDSERLELACC